MSSNLKKMILCVLLSFAIPTMMLGTFIGESNLSEGKTYHEFSTYFIKLIHDNSISLNLVGKIFMSTLFSVMFVFISLGYLLYYILPLPMIIFKGIFYISALGFILSGVFYAILNLIDIIKNIKKKKEEEKELDKEIEELKKRKND